MTPAHIRALGALALLTILALVIGSRVWHGGVMQGQGVNRLSGGLLVALSFIALLDVVGGYFLPGSLGDEGTAAHVFQLAVVAAVLVGTLFLGTARWSEGWLRAARPLVIPGMMLTVAFGALFYLEHHYR